MKAILFVAALALAAACGKHNDAHVLQEEAVTLAKYYQPKLDTLDQRVQAIFKRGSTIPGNLPGIEDVGKRLQEARDTIVKLRGIIGAGPDGKSAVEKQAEAAAKDNKVADLQKLVHDTEVEIDRGVTIINDDLDSVEAWIANYDRKTLAMNTAPAGGQQGEQAPTPPAPEQPVNPAQPAAPAQTPPAPAPAQPEPPKQ